MLMALYTLTAYGQNLQQNNTITNSFGEQVEFFGEFGGKIISVTTSGFVFSHNYNGSGESIITSFGTNEITAAHLQGNTLYVTRDLASSSGPDVVSVLTLKLDGGNVVVDQFLGDQLGLSNASDITVLSDGKRILSGNITGIGESFRAVNSNNTLAYDYTPTVGFGNITAISSTALFGGVLAVADSLNNNVRFFDNNCTELFNISLQHVFGVDFTSTGKLVATSICPSTIHIYYPILNDGVIVGFEEEFTYAGPAWDFVVSVKELTDGSIVVNDQGFEELIRHLNLNSNVTITGIGKESDGNSYCMSWTSTGNAVSFQVQRSFNGGAYVDVGSAVTADGSTNYSKTIPVVGSSAEATNYYRLVSSYVDGTTAYSSFIPYIKRNDSQFAGGADTGLMEASFVHLQ